MSGGEVDAARLLKLARHELLEEVVPQLSGDARYRARLIANAMKIAARELDAGPALAEETARLLRAFAETALTGEAGTTAAGVRQDRQAICAALRAGTFDSSPALYELLGKLTERRRKILG